MRRMILELIFIKHATFPDGDLTSPIVLPVTGSFAQAKRFPSWELALDRKPVFGQLYFAWIIHVVCFLASKAGNKRSQACTLEGEREVWIMCMGCAYVKVKSMSPSATCQILALKPSGFSANICHVARGGHALTRLVTCAREPELLDDEKDGCRRIL